jgi:Flp pilus assembly pilin Flp
MTTRSRRLTRTEHGMTTAEYAFGIIAAVGFACLLFLLQGLMTSILKDVFGGIGTFFGSFGLG